MTHGDGGTQRRLGKLVSERISVHSVELDFKEEVRSIEGLPRSERRIKVVVVESNLQLMRRSVPINSLYPFATCVCRRFSSKAELVGNH